MRALRSAVFGAWMYGAMVGLFLVWSPTMLLHRRYIGVGLRTWARAVLWGLRVIGGVTVEVRGREHAPSGTALVAGKHFAMLDTIVPFLALDDPAFVLKSELMALPLFGWVAAKIRLIPVDREANATALRKLTADARDRLSDGRQILIFPEGTRTAPGDSPAYKPGVAGLYRELDVACTPLATNSGEHWSARGLTLTPGRVVYAFLPAIPPGLKRAEFMRTLQERVETATAALLAEAPADGRHG